MLGGIRAAQRAIGSFLLAVGLINSRVAVATGLAAWWLGLPNPVLWAVMAAVLKFVPYIGPLVMVVLLSLAGMFTFNTAAAMVAPALAFVVLHAVESNLVSP